jgi:hypothetical protein
LFQAFCFKYIDPDEERTMVRKIALGMVMMILVVTMAACSMGQEVTVPEREVTIDNQTAVDAQNLAMGGLMMGSATLDESQFSSLLTELLKANSGENLPVESIKAWFEPGTIYLQLEVSEGVFPEAFGTTAAVAGTVDVVDGKLVLDLSEASAGGYKVEGAALAPINDQINAALAGIDLGVPVEVETSEGSLTISMAQ